MQGPASPDPELQRRSDTSSGVHAGELVAPDPELQALQEEWAPSWSIWRARRSDDPPEVRRGEFVASRMDDAAGTDRTLMRPTAVELDKALRQQGQG